MLSKNNFNFINCIGHQTLLYGETNTGKTYLSAKFIDFLLISEKVDPDEVTVLDFAPPLHNINNVKFGGKIKDFSKLSLQCKYLPLQEEIIPPRFIAQNKKQLFEYVCHNYQIASRCLKTFEENPTAYLIINDVSIYLHLGGKCYLLRLIYDANTFFGNTYYGTEIKSDFSKLLSLKERKRVEFLIKHIENPILTS